MNYNQMRTTDLSLLRKILENHDDTSNFSFESTDGCNEEEMKIKKSNDKTKRTSLKYPKPDFYLSENNLVIRNWLKGKKKIIKQNKREMHEQKLKDKLKNETEQKQREERLALARLAYDNWLKETRKKQPMKIPKDIQSQSISISIKESNNNAFNEWLAKKQKSNKLVSVDINNNQNLQLAKENTKNTINNNICKPMLSKQKCNRSNMKYVPDRSIDSNVTKESEDSNENFKKTIIDLCRIKRKQADQSKKRVNSGIIFQRNKNENINLSTKANDRFLWKFAEQERGETVGKSIDSNSNSRSRKVDQISHNHENPFTDRSLEINRLML